MQARRIPIQVPPSSLFSPKLGNLVRPLDPMLTRVFFRDRMLAAIPQAEGISAVRFAHEMLQNLGITYHLAKGDNEHLPASGAALVVANHPFGLLEGLLLLSLLEKIRPDYRIVANGMLSTFPPLRERVIFVNPFEERAFDENRKSLRVSLEWLSNGGLLVMFPAGEVSHMQWNERSVVDPKWNTAAARFAMKTHCPTLPLFFEGANSHRFQMVGTIHPRLRTLNLLNELLNKSSRQIRIRIGNPIPASTLQAFASVEAATEYLRARTYLLGDRPVQAASTAPRFIPFTRPRAIIPPVAINPMTREISSLPPDAILASNTEFTVYLATAQDIPETLREIGRLREITYRVVGEGTGRALDLDTFDSYYRHIVLWHAADQRVAGAYRLAATPDIFPSRGIDGLYSSTLFHYHAAFFEHIGPAIELGRSFVCREYQKLYSPLLLLWKGILAYVARRPECAVLFGAVSMSSDYQPLSRTLLVKFLSGHVSHDASQWIRPRRGFRGTPLVSRHVKQLSRLLPTVEELSSTIQDLEADGKGLPVLIRQYLKVGGQLLGSSVDPRFSNALDVLVMTDLRTASGPMLDRCLGRAAAARFRAWQARN